tara:strand:+ start:194 stop:808 length:615 start_codon:yes stop_codon:yes gene_type:complete
MEKMKTHLMFPSPVFECSIEKHEELNLELTKYIYELREKDKKGLDLSNSGGGWHSPYFEISKIDVLKKFVSKIFPFIFEITTKEYGWNCTPEKIRITGMWSVINKKNSYNLRHFHPNCNLSAAYYVKAKEKCGNIKFFDPIDQKAMQSPVKKTPNSLSSEVASFTPNEGDLLIFPSYLHHSVDENLSEEDRIVISFNVEILRNP